MKRCSIVFGLLALGLVAGGVFGDDQKQPNNAKAPPARVRGTLPRYWNRLGLTDEQKQQVYHIQAEYDAKVAELREQIRALRAKADMERQKVLTAAQKDRLREIFRAQAPKDDKPVTPKRSTDNK